MLDSLMVGALGVEEEAPITLLFRVRAVQFFFVLSAAPAKVGKFEKHNIINTTPHTLAAPP